MVKITSCGSLGLLANDPSTVIGPTAIIEREFKAATGAQNVAVSFDGEIINVTADGQYYTFEIGSDDDEFFFVNRTDPLDCISIPIPEDYC